MGDYEILRFGSREELARAAARALLNELQSGLSRPVSLALPGGRVAKDFFSAISHSPNARELLREVHFFWGDERCVPPSDPESNFALAWENLLSPLGIEASWIHRVRGELAPTRAAEEAEAEIRSVLRANGQGQPVLDIVFLGMGEDGHVASLFPGEPGAAMSSPAAYRAVRGPKPPPDRVTLGYPALAAARQVWVLISGPGKAAALQHSLRPLSPTPLGRVIGFRGKTRVFTDVAEMV